MPDPIQKKLGAYLDGELNRREANEIEAHLATCAACRDELEQLKSVSNLLRVSRTPEFTSPADFKAQLMLQLPRRGEPALQNKRVKWLWAAPVAVLLAFIFLQVTWNLSTLLSLAGQIGGLNARPVEPSQTLWFSLLQMLPGDILNTPWLSWLSFVNEAGVFTRGVLITLLAQIGAALLYWGLLVLAWRKTGAGQQAGLSG